MKLNHSDVEPIINEVREFILNDLGRLGINKLSIDDNLFMTGILDSMGTLEVINFCEQRYQIIFDLSSISEETFSSLYTLSSAILECMRARS